MGLVLYRRQQAAPSAPLAIAGLLIGAAVLLAAGQIKAASIDAALRHTSAAAATVLRVNANRVASVQYVVRGKPHTGNVNVSDVQGIDGGDKLTVRVAQAGGKLQLAPVFHPSWYDAPAATMAATAAFIGSWMWRSSIGRRRDERRRLWPGELSRLHRRGMR